MDEILCKMDTRLRFLKKHELTLVKCSSCFFDMTNVD